MSCPICNTPLKSQNFYGDGNGVLEEAEQKCPAATPSHYVVEFSYGLHAVYVNGEQFGWHWSDSREHVATVEAEIAAAVEKAKKTT